MLVKNVTNCLEALGLTPLAEPQVLKGGDIAAVVSLGYRRAVERAISELG